MRQAWWAVSSMVALLCGLTGCLKWPDAQVSSMHPDKELFERGISAVDDGRFAVASMTLQTLISTYPDSEFASKAKLVLEDPRIAECFGNWNPPQCDGRFVTTPP